MYAFLCSSNRSIHRGKQIHTNANTIPLEESISQKLKEIKKRLPVQKKERENA